MVNVLNWARTLIPETQDVFKRFPLATFLVGIFTGLLLLKANFIELDDETLKRLVGGVVLSAYLAVIMALVGEGREKPVPVLVQAVICALAIVAAWFYQEISFLTPMAIGASILYLGNALFFRQGRDDVAVWDFTHKLWTAVIFTVAGSIIYTIGVFSISSALKSLFALNIRHLVEDWLLPIGLGFLAPLSWLSMLPHKGEHDGDSLRDPGFISRAVGFLGTWILAPLTLIYAAILVAYGVKILLLMQIPNGEIAKLVTPFLVIGTLTWLILDPPFILEKRLARWFQKLWFWISIPAALLLAVAVIIRVHAYGLTIERYLLGLAVIWALGNSLWFGFQKKSRRDIRIIPGFAALLLALTSFGPWGADGLSTYSQVKRLKTGLAANHFLDENGKLKPRDDIQISEQAQAVKAKGALAYLIKRKKSKHITALIDDKENFELYGSRGTKRAKRYIESNRVYRRFGLDGVKLKTRYGFNGDNATHIRFERAKTPVKIAGYEYLSPNFSFYGIGKQKTKVKQDTFGEVSIFHDKDAIVIERNGQELAHFDALQWARGLKPNANNMVDDIPPIVLYENGDERIALVVREFNANFVSEPVEPGQEQVLFLNLQYRLLFKGIKL